MMSNLMEPVKAMCEKFRKAFQLFRADKGYSTGKAMDEKKLGMVILNPL